MDIQANNGALKIRAFAKLNLFLEVIARRPDRLHEIDSVFHEIDLADTITIRPDDSELTLTCSDRSIPQHDNIAYASALALREKTGCGLGARIHLEKKIPSGAGLGGGSSDAAAVLVGLNRLWTLGLSTDDLHRIGETIGSDVPFFFYGGTGRVRGRGERIDPLPHWNNGYWVLIRPPFAIPTGQIYENLTLALTSDQQDGTSMIEALREGQPSTVGKSLFNRLQAVAVSLYPALQDSLNLFMKSKTSGILMSGSGSTVFALHESEEAAHSTYTAVVKAIGRDHVYRANSTAPR